MSDGTKIPLDILYVVTRSNFTAPFASELGCDIAQGPVGPMIVTDIGGTTTVPGVYAAGDITAPFYGAVAAAADGARAGSFAHQSLVMVGE